jgi:hypothetical protein
MKKFLLVLIILLLIGGTGFYFGWIQLRIPENHYGVAFTKTSGYHEEVYEPGRFYWKIERLLPTNMQFHLFDLSPRNRTIELNGTLPSGDLYAQMLPDPVSFSYNLTYSISYRIKPEMLPTLVEKSGISPEELDAWYAAREASITDIVASITTESQIPDQLSRKIEERFPELEVLEAGIITWNYPDRELYHAARSFYLERISALEAAEDAAMALEREWIVSKREKLAVLEEYGKLLSNYPGLLQLALASAAEESNLDFPTLEELLSTASDANQ